MNKRLCNLDDRTQYSLPFGIEHLFVCKVMHHGKASTFQQVNVTASPLVARTGEIE